MSMAGRVDRKVALITGAARGQGRAHAIRLAQEGADIIAVDICDEISTARDYPAATPDDLDRTVKEVENLGRRIVARRVDVRDFDALRSAVDAGVAELGHLDIVVANAAIATYGISWELSTDEWQEMIDINLTGVWHTTKATVPHLLRQGSGGSIVLISSVAGVKGIQNLPHYAAAKHGVIGLMRTLAQELGSSRIRVNSVAPTNVDTPMIHHPALWRLAVPGVEEPTREQSDEAFTHMHLIPVPFVDPVDISNAVLFLASDEARYITGVTLPVDAGVTAR